MANHSIAGWILGGGLLLTVAGCSCSSIPESPPGPGPVSEVRSVNSGAIVPPSHQPPAAAPTVPTTANDSLPNPVPLPGGPAQ